MKDSRIRTGLTGIAAAGLLIGASFIGPAQARPHEGGGLDPAQRVETRIERMTDQLGLTEAQQAEIRKILEAQRAQRDLQRQALRDQIDAVLTDEQKARRDAAMQTRLDRRLERMTERLDLTDEQVASIKAIFDEQRTNPDLNPSDARERISAILTDEQRAVINDRSKRHSGSDRQDSREPTDRDRL
jgi:Spy/CpxP family protein refolding chaperone